MQPDSRVDNLLLPFHNLCLYVKAGMHACIFQWAAGVATALFAFFLLFISSGLVESSMVLILICS